MGDRPTRGAAGKKKSAAEKKAEKERKKDEARRSASTLEAAHTQVGYRSSEGSTSEATMSSLLLPSEGQEPEMTSFRTGLSESGKVSSMKPGEASASTSKLQGIPESEGKPPRGKLSPAAKQMAAVSARIAEEGPSRPSRRSEPADVGSSPAQSELKEKDAEETKSGGKTVSSKHQPLQRQRAVSFGERSSVSDSGKAKKSSKVKEGEGIETRGRAARSPSPIQQIVRWAKKMSPGKKETAHARSRSSSQLADPAEKSPAKPEGSKMALRSKSPKQGAAAAAASPRPQPSSSGSSPSGSRHSSESAASDLAKHGKKGAFAGRRHRKASDEMPIVEESMETSESEKIVWKTCKGVAKQADVQKQVEPSPDKEDSQELGRPRTRLLARQSTIDSTVDELPTDVSMVSSDSSMQVGSELIEGSTSSSGTQSQVGVASGSRKVRTPRKPLQGQKRVNIESKDGDEETRAFAAIGSPMKKAPPPVRESEDPEKE